MKKINTTREAVLPILHETQLPGLMPLNKSPLEELDYLAMLRWAAPKGRARSRSAVLKEAIKFASRASRVPKQSRRRRPSDEQLAGPGQEREPEA
jgi:hypothetical protein